MSDPKQVHESLPDNPAPAEKSDKTVVSRRVFLKGAGFTAAGTALLDGVRLSAAKTQLRQLRVSPS